MRKQNRNAKSSNTQKPVQRRGKVDKVFVDEPKNAEIRRRPYSGKAAEDAINNLITNDPAFYDHNPIMVQTSGSISWETSLGNRMDLSQGIFTTGQDMAIPGIMAMRMLTGPGQTTGVNTDPVNIAADNIYGFVRHENSGGRNYEPADMILTILAFDEIYMWMEYAFRAYGTLNLYNPQNKYVPRALIEAQGWDYDDLLANSAQFLHTLQTACVSVNSYNIPDQYSLLERHRRLYRGLYMDENTGKAQLYIMKPFLYRTYKETDGAGYLEGTFVPSKLTTAQWTTAFNTMMDAIRNSEDIGDISGDILKAYGSANMIRFQPIDFTYSVAPTADPTLLNQFRNATDLVSMGAKTSNLVAKSLNVSQTTGINTGDLVYDPQWAITTTDVESNLKAASGSLKTVLDLPLASPTPMDVIEASRLMVQVRNVSGGQTTTWGLHSAGSEVVWDTTFYFLQNSLLVPLQFPSIVIDVAGSSASFPLASSIVARCFDYRPTQYYVTAATGSSNPQGKRPGGDLNNYAILANQTLANLHETAILSEFSVPIH